MKKCNVCGQEMVDEAVFCPNCGANQAEVQAAPEQPAYESQPTYNAQPIYAEPVVQEDPPMAKKARLFGILSLAVLAPFGIPGIILAILSKKQTGGRFCGSAKAGFIMSIIGLAIWFMLYVIIVAVSSAASSSYYYY